MILFAVIFLVIAVVALGVGMVFAKNKGLHALLFVLSALCLVAFGVACGSYVGDFGGGLLFLIVSPLPLVLCIVDVSEEEKTEYSVANEGKIDARSGKKLNFSPIVHGLGALFCGICVYFSAMYIGIESMYGVIGGICLGLAIAFLKLGLAKETSSRAFFETALYAISAGLVICAGICAIGYDLALCNIIFLLGSLLLGASFICNLFIKSSSKRYVDLLAFVSLMLLIASTIL